jgi:glyoxylase-like metal-dependent hydrolase (beta-lactamase superfamily II)
VDELIRGVWTHALRAEGFPTISSVVLTRDHAFVVDTLLGPAEIAPVVAFVEERGDRRLVVVNTHHHWDHVYGNSAFRRREIVAQRACPGLILAQATLPGVSRPAHPAEGVELPGVTFGDRLTYADGDETVHLIHTPGHSEDSLVVYLEHLGVLLGGDTVEWPFPSFAQRDAAATWVSSLRRLKQLPLELVVPSHGPRLGKELLDANERYVSEVYEAVGAVKHAGVARGALDLPAARFLPADTVVDEVYEAVHRANLEWAYDEV